MNSSITIVIKRAGIGAAQQCRTVPSLRRHIDHCLPVRAEAVRQRACWSGDLAGGGEPAAEGQVEGGGGG